MIILRNKIYSSSPTAPRYNPDQDGGDKEKKNKNTSAKLTGEVLGTATIGSLGALGAGGIGKKVAKGVVSAKAGKEAKAEYKKFLKGEDYRRLRSLEQIEAKRALEKAPYEKNWWTKFTHRFERKSADYVAEGRRDRLAGELKKARLSKKAELAGIRDAKIAKAGRIGKKAGLVGGLALTSGLVAKKVYDSTIGKRKRGSEND